MAIGIDIPLEYVALAGIALGTVGRTYLPYLKKTDQAAKTNTNFGFALRYLGTALLSILISSILTFALFVIPQGTQLQVFIAATIFSWGTNDVINRFATTT
jgi:hypothetical protein